ncbi:YitT family protein [Macrococcus hajekii]|uniref:YitT family protein n=1 Tax=Macrococcus hajekii TaxID=198482 RepID=A0A4R6BJU8_9STAP|nr:YitT family protein [Macrococcus hajekii]TDM01993.1 YitT family protein [Macrococcus hajekii]GGB09127.1 membrane protein [Macrococcus hajekii]
MRIQDHLIFKTLITIIGSFIIAISFNLFLLPHHVLSSGLSGAALLIHILTSYNTGIINLLINLPLIILGFFKLPRQVMLQSLLSVAVISFFLSIIPIIKISPEPLVDVIFGGVLCGAGVGIILKYSGTTGGMDIIAMIISRQSNISIGAIMTILNGIIVLCSGFFLGWSSALTTLVSIYITGKAIDTIFTSHIKLTINIVTSEGEAVRQALIASIRRGMTISDTRGGYTGKPAQMIVMVLTRYELQDAIRVAKEADPHCFINVYETTEVHGNFAKSG